MDRREWYAIDFTDDREACTFTAAVRFTQEQDERIDAPRRPVKGPTAQDKGAPEVVGAPVNAPLTKLQGELLALISNNPNISYDEMAQRLGKSRTTIMRSIGKMKDLGIVLRRGSRKTGHWEVREEGR